MIPQAGNAWPGADGLRPGPMVVYMDAQDEALIAEKVDADPVLRSLVDSHRDFKRQLDEIYKRPHLSAEEDFELKRLKKEKLAVKGKIEYILSQYRAS